MEAADILVDTAPCGFVSFTDDGSVAYVNGTLCVRLGYTRGELLNRHVEGMLSKSARLFFQTHFFPLLKMHGRADEIFLLLRAKDGEEIGTICNAVQRHRDGAAVTDCVFLEVRERRKYEDALLEAKRAADAANRAKSNFLAVMSHELRTPLNAIGGYAQLLASGVYEALSPAQLQAVERIEQSGRRLLGLVNDVLDLARVESGHVEYRMAAVPLADIVAALWPMIAPQVSSKSLRYSASLEDEPLIVHADRERLVQILLNLLSNAVKFTPQGGEIVVSCAVDRNDQDAAIIEVRDTGRGIPAEKLDSIFEPFIQVRGGASADAKQGTGLGLAIGRTLARGMGGDLTAASNGAGSTFTLRLVRAQTAAS
jgi:signal transduction histidine kinase